MVKEYQSRQASDYFNTEEKLNTASIDYKLGEIANAVMYLHQKIDNITTTINTAAQSMPQSPDLKHRSLHEWDDNYLINELVERENDLMPFYYELLKRIGSPELQKLVRSSMDGKYKSMAILSELCSAMAHSQPQQVISSPPAPYNDARKLNQQETLSVIQEMAQNPRMQSQHEPNQFAQQFNSVVPRDLPIDQRYYYNPNQIR